MGGGGVKPDCNIFFYVLGEPLLINEKNEFFMKVSLTDKLWGNFNRNPNMRFKIISGNVLGIKSLFLKLSSYMYEETY